MACPEAFPPSKIRITSPVWTSLLTFNAWTSIVPSSAIVILLSAAALLTTPSLSALAIGIFTRLFEIGKSSPLIATLSILPACSTSAITCFNLASTVPSFAATSVVLPKWPSTALNLSPRPPNVLSCSPSLISNWLTLVLIALCASSAAACVCKVGIIVSLISPIAFPLAVALVSTAPTLPSNALTLSSITLSAAANSSLIVASASSESFLNFAIAP